MRREIKLPAQGHTAASGKIRSREHFDPWSWRRLTCCPATSVTPPRPLWTAIFSQALDQVLAVGMKKTGLSESVPGRKAGVRGQLKMGVWPPVPRASGIHQQTPAVCSAGTEPARAQCASPSPPVTRSTQSLVHTPIRNPIISVS